MVTTPRKLVGLALGIVATLVACGDRNGPLNPAGVWKYGVAPVDTTPVAAEVGDVPVPPPPGGAPAVGPRPSKPVPGSCPSTQSK